MLMDMPDGFPSSPHRRGDDHIITLRFPRFNHTVFYDPTVDSTNELAVGTDPTDSAIAPLISITALSAGLLLAFAASRFTRTA